MPCHLDSARSDKCLVTSTPLGLTSGKLIIHDYDCEMKKSLFVAFLIVLFASACNLFGVHFKLHNPNRAGKYPEKTEALHLLGDQESKYRMCYDVTYYNLMVTFSDNLEKDKSISGSVLIVANALQDFDTLQVDLQRHMDISKIYHAGDGQNGGGVKGEYLFFRKEDAVFVVFPKTIMKGEIVKLLITFGGTPPDAKRPPWRGGFVRKKDSNEQPWWGVACQSEGTSMWWPCKDVVNDEPDSARIHLRVPDGLVAVSNGILTYGRNAEYICGNDTKAEFEWKVSHPINLYNITFYIGKYKLLHDTYFSKVTGDTLQLNHYVLEQDYEKAKAHFPQLKEHLAVYEDLFGPYPFYRDGFKLVEAPYAGMEHQTAIAYGNGFKNNALGFDYIILHETAHEWWGNSLTAYDLADGWLHEGFATYAECLYVERKYGYKAYTDYLRTYRWTIINRRPLVGPYGQRYFNYKDGDIYTKGAWILHTLRETINDDKVFFDIIKTFATRFAYKNVKSQDFIAIVNEKTSSDYNWFFDQYLYNRFVPELEYYKDDGVFYYCWNDKYTNEYFPLPVVVKGVHETGTDTLVPIRRVSTMQCSGDQQPEMRSNILVKFTENKKLKREYNKMRAVNDWK